MIELRTQLIPFQLRMMLGRRTEQQRPTASVLLTRLPIFLLLVLWIVLVALSITNTTSGAVALALLIVVLKVFTLISAHMIAVLFLPVFLVNAVLVFAGIAPRLATLKAPRIAPIFVPNVNRKAINRLLKSTFLTRFHRIPFAIPFSK